jgi:hypothetical protein
MFILAILKKPGGALVKTAGYRHHSYLLQIKQAKPWQYFYAKHQSPIFLLSMGMAIVWVKPWFYLLLISNIKN